MITPYSNIISVTTLEALLLDTYSGAAAAYSLRKLSATYTGSAIRVRRASDNTEQDIGFVSNELDTSALTTFCSGTDGFVETWYDQSGNANDATQATAADQPQIVSSGSVILDNGKPALEFDGTRQMETSWNLTILSESIFVVGLFRNANSAFTRMIEQTNNTTIYGGQYLPLLSGTSTNFIGYFDIERAAISITNDIQYLFTSIQSGTNLTNYLNSTTNASSSFNHNVNYNLLAIGGKTSVKTSPSAARLNGKIQEIIIYTSDESTNRTNIETNINNFYSIY